LWDEFVQSWRIIGKKSIRATNDADACYDFMKERWMVIYDGQCRFCSRWVRWIIRNDVHRRFSFKALQALESDTVQLLMEGKQYGRSSAVLQIVIRLRFPWPLLGIFFMVPRFIRDPFYNLVARNRRLWFGENDTNCVI